MTGRLRRGLQLAWIGRDRLRAYSIILLIVSVASFYGSYRQATGPTGSDFLAFWSAGRLVASGAADRVYDIAATGAVQATVGRADVFAFVNPPPFLLAVAPLGLLGYVPAWFAWIGVTYAAWFAAARRLDPRLAWPIAAFPGALVAGWHARTGLLTGALLAGAASKLERRPALAGALIGALVIKPHLALLLPLALAAGKHWRAFRAAAATVVALVAITALVFGTRTILNYRESWAVSRFLMSTGDADFFLRQSTVYAAVRVMASPLAASLAQAAATLAVAVGTWRVWSGTAPTAGKLAYLMAAIPLATPYLFAYDLAFLIVPVAWLAGQARDRPRGGWERPLVLAFYLSPLIARAAALPTGIVVAPWVEAAMLWAVWRRLSPAVPPSAEGGDGRDAPIPAAAIRS